MSLAFEEEFQQVGGKIVASEIYQLGDKTFDAQLTSIQAANPDVLFLASFYPEVPLVMAQAREMGIEVTFLGSDGWDEPEKLIGTLDDNAPLAGAYFFTNFSSESPDAAPFVEAYTAMFTDVPDGTGASGYDGMRLLAIVIEEAQSLESAAIRDALVAITDYQWATFIVHYDKNRHPIKKKVVHTIRDG